MSLKPYQGFLNTPPLWKNEQFSVLQFDFPKIDLATFSPKPIPDTIRLGHQMEHVFQQLLEHAAPYEILLHNLPIRREKQTLGEIDFILQDRRTTQRIHVELTYKFYIIHPQISEPIHQLMGPNKRDMFFTKLEKIKNQQFALLHSPEGIRALASLDIDHSTIQHQVCYKAQLFAPYTALQNHIRPLETGCIVGRWLYFDAFKSAEFKANEYYLPYKSQWVIAPHNDVVWSSHFEILMEVNLRMIQKNSPMLWMRTSNGTFEKFFIVWW